MAKPYGQSRNPDGRPTIWGKGNYKTKINLTLTQEGRQGLEDLASEWGLSKSELVERIARRLFVLEQQASVDSEDQDKRLERQDLLRQAEVN